MAGIFVPRRFFTQPSGPVGIAYDLRSIAVCGFHPAPWPMDPVEGRQLAVNGGNTDFSGGSITWDANGGAARKLTSVNDWCRLLVGGRGNAGWLPTFASTLFMYMRHPAVNANGAFIGLSGSTLSTRMGIYCTSGTNLTHDWGGQVEGTSRLSYNPAGSNAGTINVWCWTTGARGMELWKNGLLVASNSGTTTRSNTTDDYRFGNSTAGNASLATWFGVLLLNRQLPVGDIARISANFYSIYRPISQRFYFPVFNPDRTIDFANTDANDSISAAIGLNIAVAFAKTDANDSISSALTNAGAASFAKTDANDTLTASLTKDPVRIIDLSLTEEGDALSCDMIMGRLAAAALTDDDDTIDAHLFHNRIVDLSLTDADDAFSSTLLLNIAVAASLTDAPDTIAASGAIDHSYNRNAVYFLGM